MECDNSATCEMACRPDNVAVQHRRRAMWGDNYENRPLTNWDSDAAEKGRNDDIAHIETESFIIPHLYVAPYVGQFKGQL